MYWNSSTKNLDSQKLLVVDLPKAKTNREKERCDNWLRDLWDICKLEDGGERREEGGGGQRRIITKGPAGSSDRQ